MSLSIVYITKYSQVINSVALPIHWEPNGHKCERSILHLKYQTVGLRRRVGTISTPYSVLFCSILLNPFNSFADAVQDTSSCINASNNPCKPPLSNQSIRAYRNPLPLDRQKLQWPLHSASGSLQIATILSSAEATSSS